MREQLKKDIKEFLDKIENFFHTEEELQLLLARHLMDIEYYDQIFVEYYVSRKEFDEDRFPWVNDSKISIDIVVQKGNDYLPIEIKYKTKAQIFPHKVFGKVVNVTLTKQGAQNEGCYSFWKDVKRIEILKETFNLNYDGFVLFITNDHSYKNPPRLNSQYAPFSIHNGREVKKGDILKWDNSKTAILEERLKKFPAFSISNNYIISWNELRIENHIYLLI
jgi:hypothetical protein